MSPSTYAKFYFDLRSLAEENGLLFPEEYVPLTRDRASKIEVRTWYHYMLGTRRRVMAVVVGGVEHVDVFSGPSVVDCSE